jgi:anti-sigma regulatory factor (Ser/Thr protein kinase)
MTESIGQTVHVVVDEPSKVGDARRRAVLLAKDVGFNETQQGTAALIATEAASNLIKHGGGGELVVQAIDLAQVGLCLDISAIDSGCGMRDLRQCLVDGHSTAGSPGTGLGAISRLASQFDVYSRSAHGTLLHARLLAANTAAGGNRFETGVIRVACPGEQVCGDSWVTIERGGALLVMVVDGLGHGPAAGLAAEEAVRVFRGHRSDQPAEIVNTMHEALRATRGAAVAVARVDRAAGKVHYAGVGNISGVIINGQTGATTSMVSQNGTVGYTIRRVQTFDYAWSEGSLLLMHSDGVGTHWKLDRYPGLARQHPALLAGALYRDYKRGRDDATVVVLRWGGGDRE